MNHPLSKRTLRNIELANPFNIQRISTMIKQATKEQLIHIKGQISLFFYFQGNLQKQEKTALLIQKKLSKSPEINQELIKIKEEQILDQRKLVIRLLFLFITILGLLVAGFIFNKDYKETTKFYSDQKQSILLKKTQNDHTQIFTYKSNLLLVLVFIVLSITFFFVYGISFSCKYWSYQYDGVIKNKIKQLQRERKEILAMMM